MPAFSPNEAEKLVYMKTVMVFGTFDILHPGHLSFLRQAKKYGDRLIVIIARDATVKIVKKNWPVNPEKQRQASLKSLNLADKVILGNFKNKYSAIKKHRPEIICLGYDQINFVGGLKIYLNKQKLKTRIIRLKALKPHKYKTSIIKNIKYL